MSASNSVADPDPGSGAFLTPGSGMEKTRYRIQNRVEYPGYYFGELISGYALKYLQFFYADPDLESGFRDLINPGSRIRDGKRRIREPG